MDKLFSGKAIFVFSGSCIPDNPAIHNPDVALELAATAGAGPPHHRVGDAGSDLALEEDALPRAHSG